MERRYTSSQLPVVIPIATKLDTSGKILLDGNVLLGNITCVSKSRLGDCITTLTSDEMKKVDSAISKSLDINHYYQTLQNKYDDKMKYIEKLKTNRTNLEAELAHANSELDSFKNLLQLYNLNNIEELNFFLKEH